MPTLQNKVFTPRQREIMSLVCGGKTDKEIAYELGISEGTVGNQLRLIFKGLRVNCRLSAALRWKRF